MGLLTDVEWGESPGPLEELMTQLREQGIEDVSQVRAAYMEPDGRISVLTDDDEPVDRPPRSHSMF